MRTPTFAILSVLAVIGCDESLHDKDLGTLPGSDGMCPSLPDMAQPPAKCAAAKGLAGDVVGNLCIDFSTVPDQSLMNPPPQQLPGWDFGNPANCWEIKSGKLQIKNFSTFMSSCGFAMPALSAADYNKYSSFTLAIVQTVDINPAQQSAFVYLGAELPAQRIWNVTGKYAKMATVFQIAKADLPNGGSGAYQALFKITSAVGGGGFAGWQIESIAVMGNL